jgi:site-specific DNA-cytosine methylase
MDTPFPQYLGFSPNWGIALNGRYLIARITESHNTEKGSILRDILEPQPDRKYYLSEEAIKKIMKENKLSKKIYSGSAKEVYPILTPTKDKKRQNGRRFKNNNDPSFTLTSQDKHGVLIRKIYEITGGQKQAQRVYLPIISTTISALGGGQGAKTGLYAIEDKIRRLTPVECSRLQGFPDNWVDGHSDSSKYRVLGNAVTVNVAAEVLKETINDQ